MTTAENRFKLQSRPHDPTLNALDAKVIACSTDGFHVITSPNMTFVPQPHIDAEELRAREDGRYGVTDCFQWPQLYVEEYRWSPCILRRGDHELPDPIAWAWYTPARDDLISHDLPVRGQGWLNAKVASGLTSLYNLAKNRYDPWKAQRGNKNDIANKWLDQLNLTILFLHQQPVTYRTLVSLYAQAQRYFLDTYAFLDYVQIVQPRIANPTQPHPVRGDWMGCFTRDIMVCNDLYRAGVPVWYARLSFTIGHTMIIEKLARYTFPDTICRNQYFERGQGIQSFPLLYEGPSDLKRHAETRGWISPPDQQTSSKVGNSTKKAGSVQKARRSHCVNGKGLAKARSSYPVGGDIRNQNRDKWRELQVEEMPAQLQVWKIAMRRVAKNTHLSTRDTKCDHGYRVPEPGMLVSGKSPERRMSYLVNWLAVRPHWLRLVVTDPPARFPSPQMWRDLLCGVSLSPSSSETFGSLCPSFVQGGPMAPKEKVYWRNHEYSLSFFTDPPPRILKGILWELFEIGFRLELRALDQLLVPHLWRDYRSERTNLLDGLFTSSHESLFWQEELPLSPTTLGMWDSVSEEDTSIVLQRFCTLLSAWPNAPPALSTTSIVPLGSSVGVRQMLEFEVLLKASFFYVQSFQERFGRPPLVPHQFPVEFHS